MIVFNNNNNRNDRNNNRNNNNEKLYEIFHGIKLGIESKLTKPNIKTKYINSSNNS